MGDMGLRLQLRKETEARFREEAMKRFGFGRGALSKAGEQAIETWLGTTARAPKFEGDPVKAIQGILSETEAGSVELQHSVQKTWAAKVMHHASD